MKRWLLLLLAIPLFSLSQAQNRSLSQYEYWIDGDFASRTSHTLSNSQETITFQIDTGEMTEGIHKVGFRVQDSEGNWSGIVNSTYLVMHTAQQNNLDPTVCEYWIDGDRSNKREIDVDGNNIAFTVDASDLSEGKHQISLRVKNDLGLYSSVITEMFYYFKVEERGGEPEVCEYWLDDDFANRTEVAVVDGAVSFIADASSQVDGVHYLSWRIRDDKGKYSSINRSSYYKYTPVTPAEDIVWYQYWWNERSDLAVRTDVTDKGILLLEDILTVPDYVVNMPGKDKGTAELHILFANDKGNLSNVVTEVIEDRIPPVSHMNALPATQVTNMQMLSWEGTDRWAGVKDYTVYIYDDEAEQWNVLVADTATTSMPFYSSEYDREYKFFVIARDSLDNVEPMKTEAEASIRFMYKDIYPPVTTVQVSSKEVTAGESVEITWETIDDVSEIHSNNIYYSENDGPLILWKTVTNSNSTTFKGCTGSTYTIIVTGQDSEGNNEHPDESKGVKVRFNN